jgi:N-acetylmuramoyl-L-alanine amidase
VNGRLRLAVVALPILALLAAGGCAGPRAETVVHPQVKHEEFVYKPLEIGPPRPLRTQPAPEPAPLVVPDAAAGRAPDHELGWEVSVQPRPWRWIVIHHSASDTGSAASFDAWHRNGRHWDELGYHFVIGNGGGSGDGAVEVGSRWPKQKWGAHCRVGDNEEYNYFGIGICLVGNFEKHRPSETQMASLARLVEYLAAVYQIDDRHIIGHGWVDETRCPGRYLSFDDLLRRLHAERSARGAIAMSN